MSNLWFKRKTYGWGWTPANAKGWVALAIFVIAMIAYPALARAGMLKFDPVTYSVVIAVLTASLAALCVIKGETPKWRWGPPRSF